MPKDSEPRSTERGCKEIGIYPIVETLLPDIVHARTANWLATQPAHRPWKEKYAARMSTLEGGALSGVGVPFKATGGEISETKKLVTAVLATHPESCPVELLEGCNEIGSEPEINRSRKTADKFSKSVLELGDPHRFREAGFDVIRELLQETTERLIAGRGGEPFMENLERIKKRKQAAIDAKVAVDLQYPVVRALSNETLRRIYIKKELTSTAVQGSEEDDDKAGEEEEEEEIEETVLIEPGCSFESLHLGTEFFIEKLNCIFMLLCSLHNLRSRHLKARKPLNPEVVYSLRQFPFEKQTESASKLNSPSATDILAASASEATSVESSQSNTSLGSNLSSAGASSRNLLSLPVTSRQMIGGHGLSPAKKASQRVEVWEDLLAVETGETRAKTPPPKYRPPWQQTLTRDSLQLHLAGRKKRVKYNKSKIAMLRNDPTLLVPNFQEFLAQTREKVRRKTLQELEKMESCRLQKFRLIFQSLTSLTEIPEKYFPRMRKLLGKTETEYTTDWYRRLVDNAGSLQLRTNDVVSDLLKKLKQFVYSQPTDQPLYREKMCLLVLSIPADEIIRPAWQSALIFVMVRVLEWKLEILKYWLSSRRLYILQYIQEAS